MIALVLVTFAAIFEAQKDKIQFNPAKSWFPAAPFWVIRNYMEKRLGGSWIFDTALSFANDGWHLCKSVSLLFLFTAVLVYSPIIGTADMLLFYVVYGGVFTLFYDVINS